jgi:hypothetical protein
MIVGAQLSKAEVTKLGQLLGQLGVSLTWSALVKDTTTGPWATAAQGLGGLGSEPSVVTTSESRRPALARAAVRLISAPAHSLAEPSRMQPSVVISPSATQLTWTARANNFDSVALGQRKRADLAHAVCSHSMVTLHGVETRTRTVSLCSAICGRSTVPGRRR